MADKLIRHGTDAGYRAEIATGGACERCANAHRVYQRQFRPKGRSLGLKYASDEVIDQLYAKRTPSASRAKLSVAPSEPADKPAELHTEVPAEPSMGERIGTLLGRAVNAGKQDEYVPDTEIPPYLHAIEDDESPGEDWVRAEDDDSEFVVTKAMMDKIEENLGTYLSVVGMTAEMIDPYCGGILAENFDNIVSKWSKVISHYPKAAELFMDAKGGVVFAWIGALQATWPVLFAIYQHHLARTVQIKDGQLYRRNPGNVVTPMFDATTPPMQEQFQYSAT